MQQRSNGTGERFRRSFLMALAALFLGFFLVPACAAPSQVLAGSPLSNADARAAIQSEADYIVNCSYSHTAANGAGIASSSSAYGVFNNVRVSDRGPDWVVPETGAVGAMSLMQAAAFLGPEDANAAKYDAALDAYFDTWLVQNAQGWIAGTAPVSEQGGMAAHVYYDAEGKWVRSMPATPAATGMVLAALWKRYEYFVATGRQADGQAWLVRAWPNAQSAGSYLRRHYDPRTRLEHGAPGSSLEWLTDAVGAAVGLRCLARWAEKLKKPSQAYQTTAAGLTAGIAAMKDPAGGAGFYRHRGPDPSTTPSNGDSIDQICFLPYEADLLAPGDGTAKKISDWWTTGDAKVKMTAQTDHPETWTYFGTHWHHYFSARPENQYLYPGPGLQLAKVEWKYAAQTHDPGLLQRAQSRLQWAVNPQYSALWLGATTATEAGVGGGVQDWRDARDYTHAAAPWERFIDTSGYLIQVVLMVNFQRDTKYVPETIAPKQDGAAK
jgi:hypothetical protein